MQKMHQRKLLYKWEYNHYFFFKNKMKAIKEKKRLKTITKMGRFEDKNCVPIGRRKQSK